jgi:hypothetical protein
MTTPFDQPLDPISDSGRKLWDMATRGLDDKFNGDASKTNEFLASLTDRAALCMWDSVLTFKQDDGTKRDLINHHAMISLDSVASISEARTYIVAHPPTLADFTGEPDPDTLVAAAMVDYNEEFQLELKSKMLYHFLLNSIEGPLKTHISQKITQCLINRDGPTCLKYIRIKLGGRDNKQAVRNARSALQGLNLKEHRYDIGLFHEFINEQILIIESNGSTVSEEDLIATLMDQYKKTTNDDFLNMIRTVENNAEDDNIEPSHQDLTTKAKTRYDTLVKRKEWNRKDPRDAQIIALEAKVEAIQKRRQDSGTRNDKPRERGNKRNDSKQDKENNDSKRSNGPRGRRNYPEWQRKAPETGAPKRMMKKIRDKDVQHYWCTSHRQGQGLWVQHKPSDCELAKSELSERATLQARLSAIDSATSNETASTADESSTEDSSGEE